MKIYSNFDLNYVGTSLSLSILTSGCVGWNFPSLEKDESVMEDSRISGFQSPPRTHDLVLRWKSVKVFKTQDTPILWQSNVISGTWKHCHRLFRMVTEHDHKEKSPLWNFLSDQQTEVDQVSKTRVRHRSWPSMNPGGGISRVFLYLFMICVYICPTHLKYLLYIIWKAKQRDSVECPSVTVHDPYRPSWEGTHSLKSAQYTTCSLAYCANVQSIILQVK